MVRPAPTQGAPGTLSPPPLAPFGSRHRTLVPRNATRQTSRARPVPSRRLGRGDRSSAPMSWTTERSPFPEGYSLPAAPSPHYHGPSDAHVGHEQLDRPPTHPRRRKELHQRVPRRLWWTALHLWDPEGPSDVNPRTGLRRPLTRKRRSLGTRPTYQISNTRRTCQGVSLHVLKVSRRPGPGRGGPETSTGTFWVGSRETSRPGRTRETGPPSPSVFRRSPSGFPLKHPGDGCLGPQPSRRPFQGFGRGCGKGEPWVSPDTQLRTEIRRGRVWETRLKEERELTGHDRNLLPVDLLPPPPPTETW